MKTTPTKTRLFLLIAVGSILCLAVWAGDLEPPGPPAPTMKTLDEVEPRIPIHAADLPLTIDTPGSYYLAEDITTTGGGITIAVNNVTIDLQGFTLTGGSGVGIDTLEGDARENLVIKNGRVYGWSDDGIGLFGHNAQVLNVIALFNGGDGIAVARNSTVSGCFAGGNAGNGIKSSVGSIISNCNAAYNGFDGYLVNAGTVTQSSASFNGGSGIRVRGIASVVSECSTDNNTTLGIFVGVDSQARISGCASAWNGTAEFAVTSNSVVVDNVAESNDPSTGSGILVLGSGNRIEGNTVTGNGEGVSVDGTGNLIVRNSASGNTTNYDILAGNSHGPIVNVIGVGDIAVITNAGHPWANFEY